MTVPLLAYLLAKIACAVSVLLSLYSAGGLCYSAARKRASEKVACYVEFFNAGKDARNISIVFAALLFFVASNAVMIGDLTLVGAIADIAKLFAYGMIPVLALAFFATVFVGANGIGDASVRALCGTLRRTAVITVIAGLLVAYVCVG